MDYDKLIERLKCPQIHSCPMDGEYPSCKACQKGIQQETATAIETLRADLARVTAERDAAQALLAERSDVTGSAPITTAFGVPLDRLRELVEADREGRCGIPPVKIHQKIFRVFDGEIYEEVVCGAIWEPLMQRPRWKVFVMGHGIPYFVDEVLGKTVFLTRAEAEAALKAREQE